MSSAVVEEASVLERDAAKLRSDAAALEAELLEMRWQKEAAEFDAFDLDCSGTVDVEELRKGLEEAAKKPVDESMALLVLQAHDENKDGVLQRSEFCLSNLMDTLDKLIAEDREKEVQAWREERQQADAERQKAEAEALLPPVNEDTGVATRIASVFVYLQPLASVVEYGNKLVVFLSILAVSLPQAAHSLVVPISALTDLLEPLRALHDMPFAQLIGFFALQFFAGDRRLPKLLRYNMMQAVVLDFTLAWIPLFKLVYGWLGLPENMQTAVAGECVEFVVFFVLLICVAYAATCSLLGVVPAGIPGISARVEGESALADMSSQASPKDSGPHA